MASRSSLGPSVATQAKAHERLMRRSQNKRPMTVVEEIAAERKRQIASEGWSAEHDDYHRNGDMARAAAAYALAASYSDYDRGPRNLLAEWWGAHWSPVRNLWPWEWRWFKPKDRRRDLIRAGALIVAEIERIDRGVRTKAA